MYLLNRTYEYLSKIVTISPTAPSPILTAEKYSGYFLEFNLVLLLGTPNPMIFSYVIQLAATGFNFHIFNIIFLSDKVKNEQDFTHQP